MTALLNYYKVLKNIKNSQLVANNIDVDDLKEDF